MTFDVLDLFRHPTIRRQALLIAERRPARDVERAQTGSRSAARRVQAAARDCHRASQAGEWRRAGRWTRNQREQAEEAEEVESVKMSESDVEAVEALEPIAIVGMACRFPGAPDVATFWRNLREGVESIRVFSDEELRAAGVSPELFQQPAYVPAHGRVDDVEAFDAEFFGISPSDAAIMDPQHRVFLECAWEAIEHAGYNPKSIGDRFGVVAGAGLNTYLLRNILTRS